MAKELTINEIRIKKFQLRGEMIALLQDFYQETGVSVKSIEVENMIFRQDLGTETRLSDVTITLSPI